MPEKLIFPGLLSCRKCPALALNRLRVIAPFGTYPAPLLIVAQSPGKEEADKGIPLIGASGQYLTQCLKRVGITDADYTKTNVNLCHPPGDRKCSQTEINSCSGWLEQTIDAVNPAVILALGDSAYRSFLPDEKSSITQIRGSVFERQIRGRVRHILPTVHPAFVARNKPAHEAAFLADLITVKQLLEGTYVAPAAIPFRSTRASWAEILEVVYDDAKRPFGFDLETDSDDRTADIIGVGVCNTVGDGRYYPFEDSDEAAARMEELRPGLEDPTRVKIVSNAKFEGHVCTTGGALGRYNITVQSEIEGRLVTGHDTLTAAWLLGTVPKSLKDAIHHMFGIEMIRINKFGPKTKGVPNAYGFTRKDRFGKTTLSLAAAQSEMPWEVAEYAAQDPDASLRLMTVLEPLLHERGLWKLYTEIELPFTDILIEMERNGMLFDPTPLREAAPGLLVNIATVRTALAELIGIPDFNPASPDQVRKFLYYTESPYKLPMPKLKEGQKPGTDKISLGEHVGNPVVRAVLTYRGMTKQYGTYVIGLEKWPERDGRIHTTLKQTTVETGRVSSTDPNLQNLSGKEREDVDIEFDMTCVRRSFVAPPGYKIVAPDLSQIEIRMAAHLSGDPSMIELLTNGGDMHSNTARTIYKVTEEEWALIQAEEWERTRFTKPRWKSIRVSSKMANFGTCFGLTGHGLIMRTPQLKLTPQEAQGFIDGVYQAYPGLGEWQREIKAFVRRNGYAETIMGRRRYLPDITASDPKYRAEAERAAINVPIQGSAADYFKLCILEVNRRIKLLGLRTKLVHQVHDEIVMEAPDDEIDILYREVTPCMTDRIELKVPVKIDFEIGQNWGDLHAYPGH